MLSRMPKLAIAHGPLQCTHLWRNGRGFKETLHNIYKLDLGLTCGSVHGFYCSNNEHVGGPDLSSSLCPYYVSLYWWLMRHSTLSSDIYLSVICVWHTQMRMILNRWGPPKGKLWSTTETKDYWTRLSRKKNFISNQREGKQRVVKRGSWLHPLSCVRVESNG